MRVRPWLENLMESLGRDGDIPLRVILKSGNELEILWSDYNDQYGDQDELTDGSYMIDTRSIAAIQLADD